MLPEQAGLHCFRYRQCGGTRSGHCCRAGSCVRVSMTASPCCTLHSLLLAARYIHCWSLMSDIRMEYVKPTPKLPSIRHKEAGFSQTKGLNAIDKHADMKVPSWG